VRKVFLEKMGDKKIPGNAFTRWRGQKIENGVDSGAP
jgi:hypothetical protein